MSPSIVKPIPMKQKFSNESEKFFGGCRLGSFMTNEAYLAPGVIIPSKNSSFSSTNKRTAKI